MTRCSVCSGEVKPVIVVDVDGTLANYHDHLLKFCRDYWALEWNLHEGDRWDGEGEFEDWLGLTKAQYREAKLAFRMGGQKRNMPAYWAMVDEARKWGADPRYELWVCSSRPWQRLDNIDPDTRFWLERYSVRYDGLIFGDDKYAELLERIDLERIIMAIEDLPDQYDRAEALKIPVVQIERSHNSGPTVNRPYRGNVTNLARLAGERLIIGGLNRNVAGIVDATAQP